MDIFDYECGPKCHSRSHATELNSVITQYSLPEIQAYFQLCHSAGHQADLDGQTPLHMATICGKLDVVKWLLEEKKVDINVADRESKWTALHKAIFYGHIAIARCLIQKSALLSPLDNEGLQPLELLISDRPDNLLSFGYPEVFLWGENLNSTLGHSSEQRRPIPTPVDTFRRQNLTIDQVLLHKYHTVFLTECGRVFTCGHGQGGRLGLGNENTYLTPQEVKSMTHEKCVQIAASINHTVILTEKGTVYTCGLNNHHQLVQSPSVSKCLSPKQISIKSWKGQKPKGICASQYHTVFYMEDVIFAVGFNGGQLGFSKSERYQLQLRPVPLFEQIREGPIQIVQVTCSDAATVCLTKAGDIFVLHEFRCRKITSRWCGILKLDVTGGNLDLSSDSCLSPTSTGEKTCSLPTGGSQLVIMALLSNGTVYIWRSLNPTLRCCLFNIRNIFVSDICLSDANIGIVSIDGRAFFGSWKNTPKIIKVLIKTEENPFTNESKRKMIEKEEIEVYRLPYIHRADIISVNRQGNNFAVTQGNPLAKIYLKVKKPSNVFFNFKDLLDSDWYDVQIKCGHQIWPAHRYILAFHSNYFKKILLENQKTCDLVISIGYIHNDLLKQLFDFFYTGSCDLTTRGATFCWRSEEKQYIDHDFFMKTSSLNNNSINVVKSCDQRSSNEHSTGNLVLCNDPISLLLLIAEKFEMVQLSNRLIKMKLTHFIVDNITCENTHVPPIKFDHLKLPEFSDMTFKAEDGSEFKCHRCILIAHSEYFLCMLTNDWLEASTSKPVKFPFSADVLSILLDYIYTNEVPSLLANKNLDLLCEVLVMADQLLLTGLKDICEKNITFYINLKNVGEILEFSFIYNANVLKDICMQIIHHNLACVLESRFLDMVSDDVLNEVTKFYRKTIDSTSRRLVTPFSSGPEKTYLKSLVTYLRSNKEVHLKSDSVFKQKFPKRRPRGKTKSISEEDLIHTNNKRSQLADVVDETDKKLLTAEDVSEKSKDDRTIPQKVDCLSTNCPQRPKRDKNNPWNRIISPVKSEDILAPNQSSQTVLSPTNIVNLADIMAAEQKTITNNHQSGFQYKKPRRKSVPKTPPVAESKSSTPPSSNNPWLKMNSNQENISVKPNFSDIVQEELNKQKKSVKKPLKKPLKYIQIEEKAMEELLAHYSADYSFEENITIKRETLVSEQPVWGRKKSLMFQN